MTLNGCALGSVFDQIIDVGEVMSFTRTSTVLLLIKDCGPSVRQMFQLREITGNII